MSPVNRIAKFLPPDPEPHDIRRLPRAKPLPVRPRNSAGRRARPGAGVVMNTTGLLARTNDDRFTFHARTVFALCTRS
jgi:hypothetical protein